MTKKKSAAIVALMLAAAFLIVFLNSCSGNGSLVLCNIKLDTSDASRTQKVFHALDEICNEFDLGKPIWLETNIREFQRHAKTRFHQDSFIEEISFDYLEFHVIEEDW